MTEHKDRSVPNLGIEHNSSAVNPESDIEVRGSQVSYSQEVVISALRQALIEMNLGGKRTELFGTLQVPPILYRGGRRQPNLTQWLYQSKEELLPLFGTEDRFFDFCDRVIKKLSSPVSDYRESQT